MICECGHDQVHHQGLPSDGIERMNLHKQCRKCPCKEFANPNESKDRIKRARDFVDQHIKTLPLPVRLNGITDAEKQEAASLCSNFAAADNHLLSTRVEELEKENAKYREALEKARTAINEWKGTPHVKTGDIVIRISRYIKSALLAEKHVTAAGEGE